MSNKTPDRLQVPLQDKDGPFYPLTTYDQIIMHDGVSRFDGGVMVDRTDATIGEPALLNADLLGGTPAENYVLKQDMQKQTEDFVTIEDVQNAITEAFSNIRNGHGGAF